MRLFIIKIILFTAIFLIIDKIFILIRSTSSNKEYDKRLELVLKGEMNKDIVIIGSSRGARAIIASQIQDSLNISCHNLSYLKSNIEFHEFLLKKLIEHNDKPKIILLTIDEEAEFSKSVLEFRIDKLKPLVNYAEIRDELVLKGEKNYVLSNFFVLHQLNRSNFDFRQKKISRYDSISSCGSMPLASQYKEKGFIKFNEHFNNNYNSKNEEATKLISFKNFEKLCLNNNIKLIYVFPPNYRNSNSNFLRRFKELSDPKTIIYYYNENEMKYKDEVYFLDEGHLNAKGAVIFTDEIIAYLRTLQ